MSMVARDTLWEESYRRVSRILPTLSKKELDIIGDVADEFRKSSYDDIGIRPLTETELYARLKESVAEVERGEYRDAEEFEAEFDSELKAAYGI